MEDLVGLGKGAEKLIEVIANAIGAIYKPYGIRREADAEAYKIKVIESERISQKENETRALAEAKKGVSAGRQAPFFVQELKSSPVQILLPA